MLPKIAYRKVVQGLRKIKENWDADRKDNPKSVPYEIDHSLRPLIDRVITEEHVNVGGNKNRDILIDQTLAYLVKTNQIVKSPFGGHFFHLPKGHIPLPTRDEFVKAVNDKLKNDEFFKK